MTKRTMTVSKFLIAILLALPAVAGAQDKIAENAKAFQTELEGMKGRPVADVLNKFEDMNYADIAEVMGLSAKAVKSLLSRARGKLREALQGYIYMDGDPPPPPAGDGDGEVSNSESDFEAEAQSD